MQIMVAGRQTGKTTTVLAHLYAFTDSVLVVATNQRAMQLKQEHPDLADRIISATSSAGLRGRNPSRVYVDDVDMVLHHLIGAPVSFATATADLVELNEEAEAPEKDWWADVADIVAETYNQIADQVEGLNVDITEQMAADVARRVGDWYVSEMLYPYTE